MENGRLIDVRVIIGRDKNISKVRKVPVKARKNVHDVGRQTIHIRGGNMYFDLPAYSFIALV